MGKVWALASVIRRWHNASRPEVSRLSVLRSPSWTVLNRASPSRSRASPVESWWRSAKTALAILMKTVSDSGLP